MDESIVKHLEQPQVGTLKLSAAIRIGARLRPQCAGRSFRDGKSCALGAAYEALNGRTWPEDEWAAFPLYGKDSPLVVTGCPLFPSEIHLRNDAGMSREAIADWLESQGY